MIITVSDAHVIFDEVARSRLGTTLEVALFGLGGGETGTAVLTRESELDRWTYEGPFRIPAATHARALVMHQITNPAGVRALHTRVRNELRDKARSIQFRNPRRDDEGVVFDVHLTFETNLYLVCRVENSQALQLHAGPFRLDLDGTDLSALQDIDRNARREALSTILVRNHQPPMFADEILRAGGSTETYNLDQLRRAAMDTSVTFNEDDERYGPP